MFCITLLLYYYILEISYDSTAPCTTCVVFLPDVQLLVPFSSPGPVTFAVQNDHWTHPLQCHMLLEPNHDTRKYKIIITNFIIEYIGNLCICMYIKYIELGKADKLIQCYIVEYHQTTIHCISTSTVRVYTVITHSQLQWLWVTIITATSVIVQLQYHPV